MLDVSPRRLAFVKNCLLPARGLLSLFSVLRAFLLTIIKRNRYKRRPTSTRIQPSRVLVVVVGFGGLWWALWALVGFVGFYRVLVGFVGFYRVLSGLIGFDRV